MEFLYTFFISFFLVFLSELGDKTQLLVLSFSTKSRAKHILFGVALGTLLSHGLAILFGSTMSYLCNDTFQFYLQILTYSSFLLFGILGFIPEKETSTNSASDIHSKFTFLHKLSNIKIFKSCIFMIAVSIMVGELGDKTFLASLGLGLQYPNFKISLILGSIFGMVLSNSFALFFGRFLSSKLNSNFVKILSNLLFIIFGLLGFVFLFV